MTAPRSTRHFRISAFTSAFMLPALALLAIFAVTPARSQFGGPSAPPATQVHDPSALKPPAGSHVAIVEFEDMECPVCGNYNPLLKQAAAKYNIPWIRHDFPLPYHAWSTQAAVNARWFDTKSKRLGDDYRDAVFANQPSITTLDVLRQFTEKFAADHKIAMPFAVDPQGALIAQVNADKALGMRVGIDHTPTIWIVAGPSRGAPFIEVRDRSQLFQIIDQALADTKTGK
jgi:protein-disulfide isomerase